jgi:SH3 domain protein
MKKNPHYNKYLLRFLSSATLTIVMIFVPYVTSEESLLRNEISIEEQNKVLTRKNSILESENDILKGQNDRLSKSQRNTWFLYGALAVVMGSLLTSFLSSFTRKNKYDEWR